MIWSSLRTPQVCYSLQVCIDEREFAVCNAILLFFCI